MIVRLVLLVASALALAGCADAPTASSTAPSAMPSPTPSATSSSSSAASPAPSGPSSCPTEVSEAAFEVIQAQQRAFAASDFASARQLASQGFRSWASLRQFREIIEDGYPFLLQDPVLSVTGCRIVADLAVLRISIAVEPPVSLAYRLVLEDGTWRIDGASLLPEQPELSA